MNGRGIGPDGVSLHIQGHCIARHSNSPGFLVHSNFCLQYQRYTSAAFVSLAAMVKRKKSVQPRREDTRPGIVPLKLAQALERADTQWHYDPGARSGGETNTQKRGESESVSCIAESVAMITSEYFLQKTNTFRNRGPWQLRTFSSEVRGEGLSLSRISHANGSRLGEKDKEVDHVEELREKHHALNCSIDKVRAYTAISAPFAGDDLKRAVEAMQRLAPTCTCRDSTRNDNWSRWRKAGIAQNVFGGAPGHVEQTSGKVTSIYRWQGFHRAREPRQFKLDPIRPSSKTVRRSHGSRESS